MRGLDSRINLQANRRREGPAAVLIHRICKAQLIAADHDPIFCDVCNAFVKPDEVEEVDDSPSPFSG